MDIQLINEELLSALRSQARESERLRQNFDLRTTPADTSQRMLNVLEPGTLVPLHRHEETSETVICRGVPFMANTSLRFTIALL